MAAAANPYRDLPDRAFWKLAVSNRSLFGLDELWTPKFDIQPDEVVVTFGSCFAQHIGRAMKARGFAWRAMEAPPAALSAANARRFNYDVFSARMGNIYTTSLLLQWTRWALGKAEPPQDVWEEGGRFLDPFRPAIEPGGFASIEELRTSRAVALAAFRRCITESAYFVFTLGLTESWHDAPGGFEYPVCPGTAGGRFDAEAHAFRNQDYVEILGNLESAIDLMRAVNPALRFIVTVSPVPLTATASGGHVVVATMESKSILRAVAGAVARKHDHVDYFPSYEIINSPVTKGVFFEPNQRSVVPQGVAFVMDQFFGGLAGRFGAVRPVPAEAPAAKAGPSADDLVCEEELIEAFGGR